MKEEDNCITHPQTVEIAGAQITLLEYYIYPNAEIYSYEIHPGKGKNIRDFWVPFSTLCLESIGENDAVLRRRTMLPKGNVNTIIHSNSNKYALEENTECTFKFSFVDEGKWSDGEFTLDNVHYGTMERRKISGETEIPDIGKITLNSVETGPNTIIIFYQWEPGTREEYTIFPYFETASGTRLQPMTGSDGCHPEELMEEKAFLFTTTQELQEGERYCLRLEVCDDNIEVLETVRCEFVY